MTRPCLIIGHRGARGPVPGEHDGRLHRRTGAGVDALELDVGMTADGVVVVTHDPALNPDHTRDAAGAWLRGRGPLIRSLRAAELAAYDVGRLRPVDDLCGAVSRSSIRRTARASRPWRRCCGWTRGSSSS